MTMTLMRLASRRVRRKTSLRRSQLLLPEGREEDPEEVGADLQIHLGSRPWIPTAREIACQADQNEPSSAT